MGRANCLDRHTCVGIIGFQHLALLMEQIQQAALIIRNDQIKGLYACAENVKNLLAQFFKAFAGNGRNLDHALLGKNSCRAGLIALIIDLNSGSFGGTKLVDELIYNISHCTDSRFGAALEHIAQARSICGTTPLHTIEQVEPIGPKKLLDALIIAPCTGNTLAKLAHSIADTPVAMAAKSHLRNGRPVVIAVSTNDALSGAAENIGRLLVRKHYYFVPFGQDDPLHKPSSMVADFSRIPETLEAAIAGKQIQPLIFA